ncbi:hypothetical protein MFM001_09610 [Mycobacterium sp. MFM001]|uniref:hypothetical protein n=1 Tax=Mycobacterium sp. MFM001 TaxID=2049453 RepID=UPI000DA49757|nr:hypothetical protein [Mycobacterium sp. MFM001]GBE64499.1 hypothetical protein MFM001_09610 [Mycobacterium sp. MFM001]
MTPATRDDRTRLVGGPHTEESRATPYRLAVLGANEPDVVWAAGGLLYDGSVRGWNITVYLAECRDDRPLRILGVNSELLDGFSSEAQRPDAIIASSGLFGENNVVRAYFEDTSRPNRADVAVWGGERPLNPRRGAQQLEHRLSAAARAFKVQAMIAARLDPESVDPIEVFRGDEQSFLAAQLL